MIKYLGSKRLLVPVLGRIASAVGARTAVDLFTGTTRVAQEFKRRGLEVTAVDVATYAEVLARCYVATDAPRRRPRPAGRGARPAQRAARPPRLRHPHVLRGRALLPARERSPDRRRTRRDRGVRRGAAAGAADLPAARRRSRRLHDRPADGLPQAVGAPGRPPADPGRAGAPRRPGHGSAAATRRRSSTSCPRRTWPTSTRRTTSTGTSRTTTSGRRSSAGTGPRTTASPASAPTPATRPPSRCSTTGARCPRRCARSSREPAPRSWSRRTTTRAGCAPEEITAALNEAGHERVEAIGFDSKRYVGAQIGIHNLRGERVGEVSHLRNTEFLFLAGPTEKVEAAVAAAGHHESVAS